MSGKLGVVVLERKALLLSTFGLVGFGALVGAGSLYILFIKKRLEKYLLIQTALQSQIHELKNDIEELKAKLGTNSTVKPTLRKKKNGARVTFLDSAKSDVDDDEYVTATSSDSDFDGDAILVRRSNKTSGSIQQHAPSEQGDQVDDKELNDFLSRIDKLFEGSMEDQHEAYVILKANEDKLSDSFQFWWRYAKATHLEAGVAGQQMDKEQQKELLEQASSCAQRSLELNESADAHKWLAIATGSRGEFLKINEKIKNGYVFKEHIDRAVELNPNDASLYHLLGRFCFEVSQLSWVERRVASTLFSEPPTSTVEESLQQFLNAEKKGKPFVENRLFIAKCYVCLRDYSKVAHWLTLASQITPTTSNDKRAHLEAEELLPKYRKYLVP